MFQAYMKLVNYTDFIKWKWMFSKENKKKKKKKKDYNKFLFSVLSLYTIVSDSIILLLTVWLHVSCKLEYSLAM